MGPVALISLFSAITNVIIGIYVFLSNPKKSTNRVFSVLVLFFAIFCISEFIIRISEMKEMALFWGRIGYSMLPLLSCMVVHFSSVFPREYPNDNNIFIRYKYSLTALYMIGIILCIIFNMFVSIKDVQMSEWGFRVLLSSSTSFILYWFLLCGLYATYAFFRTYCKRNIAINEKEQIRLVATGFLLILLLSLGTNAIPPFLGISVFPMTTLSLTLFSGLIAYSMIKYNLMKLTIVETADVVVDTMVDSLIVVDRNENIVNVNKSTLDLLGYNREKLIGAPLKQVIKPSDLEKKEDIFKRLSANDKLEDTEIEVITKAGKSIPMNVSASTIHNKHGMPEGFVFVARDLTETKKLVYELKEAKTKLEDRVKERTAELANANKELQVEINGHKETEKELMESEEFSFSLLSNSPNPIVVINPDKSIEYINPALEELTGFPSAELIGRKPPYPWWTTKTMRKNSKDFNNAMNNGAQNIEEFFQGKDGEQFWVKITSKPVQLDGKLKYYLANWVDITGRKKAEIELKDMYEMLQSMNKELERKVEDRTAEVKRLLKQKDEFIHQLGHDLKNPLTPLVTLIPIIKKRIKDQKSKELLDVVTENVDFMKNLVIKTLELARLNSPNTVFDLQDINLQKKTDQVVTKQQLMFEEKNIVVENKIDKNIMVQADQLQLDELFNNLFTNAVKFTPNTGNITIDAKKEKDFISISVSDTGIGMTKEQINRIFDEFYKVDPARHDFDSSGLGLTICKKIVEKHGGRIWADSEGEGKGSTFYFTLNTVKK